MASTSEQAKTLTEKMAEFAFGLRYDSIPAEVVAAAKRQLADTLTCALGAHDTSAALAVRKYALGRAGHADAMIIGTGEKVPAGLAALVNGTLVRYLDANDIFVSSRGGPSGHCSDGTSGLLALAQQYGHSGEQLLACLVASYELQGALAESYNFWDRGLHVLTAVAWAVPIVAARLAGATPGEAVHACGLSVATSTVLNTWLRPTRSIPMIKGVAVGLVLERALECVELVKLGVTATDDAIETAFARLAPAGDFKTFAMRLGQLGERWTTTRNMIKRYPAQLYTQAAIEATLRLHKNGIRAYGVKKLVLYGHRNVCGGVQGSPQAFAPVTQEAADHSTPYVMALALMRGRLTSVEYEGAPWETAEVKHLMTKIELIVDAEADKAFNTQGLLGVRLVAELTDGHMEEIVVGQPKGHPDAPLTDAELLEKMNELLKDTDQHLAPRILELCNRIATREDLQSLIETCHVVPKSDVAS